MPVYEDLPTVVGELKRAAIDKYMSEQMYAPLFGSEDYYGVWGFIPSPLVGRPDSDGSGGGGMIGEGVQGMSMAPEFDEIRVWVDDLTENWLGLPDGDACHGPEQLASNTAKQFGILAGAPSVGAGYIAERNDTIRVNIGNGTLRGSFVVPFQDKYQARFGDVCAGLGLGAAILQVNYAAQPAIWSAARNDAATIIGAARSAMRGAADEANEAYGAIALTVVGAIAAGAASLASAGTLTPLLVGMITIAAGAAIATAGLEAHTEITGTSYDEILDSLGVALRRLDEGITGQEEGLRNMLVDAEAFIRDNLALFSLDHYQISAPQEEADELSMSRTTTGIISGAMTDIVTGLTSASSGFGHPPTSNPCPRPGMIGYTSSGPHLWAVNVHELVARCLELTLAEYERGKGLFDATVEDFFATEAAAAADVRVLAADEALTENLGV